MFFNKSQETEFRYNEKIYLPVLLENGGGGCSNSFFHFFFKLLKLIGFIYLHLKYEEFSILYLGRKRFKYIASMELSVLHILVEKVYKAGFFIVLLNIGQW